MSCEDFESNLIRREITTKTMTKICKFRDLILIDLSNDIDSEIHSLISFVSSYSRQRSIQMTFGTGSPRCITRNSDKLHKKSPSERNTSSSTSIKVRSPLLTHTLITMKYSWLDRSPCPSDDISAQLSCGDINIALQSQKSEALATKRWPLPVT